MGVFSQGLNPNSGVTGAESADYLCDQSVVCSTTPTSLIKDRDLTGTLHSGTYLYSPYMAVPPPPRASSILIFHHSFKAVIHVSFWVDLWFCRERSIEIVVVIPLLKMSSKDLFSHRTLRALSRYFFFKKKEHWRRADPRWLSTEFNHVV